MNTLINIPIDKACPHNFNLKFKERANRHWDLNQAVNTLGENTLPWQILVPEPRLGIFGPTPTVFNLNLNFPVLVTNDNIDGLVDSIMETEHPTVPYIIHRGLWRALKFHNKNAEQPQHYSLTDNKEFLQELTRQGEAWERLECIALKWRNPYPVKPYHYLDLH